MRKLIESLGFENLPRAITMPDGKALDFDQYFTTPSRNTYYLVEQKVRDDHDSSKKRGQVGNFKQKLEYLKLRHGESLVGVMYFIDPSLTKNIGYYKPELETISRELNISIYLFYNGEFFEHLTGDSAAWGILASALLAWRDSVPTDIDLNCDLPKDLDEILSVEPTVWYKLVSNEQLWTSGVVKCVFPEGTNLVKVSSKLAQTGSYTLWAGRRKIPYRELATLIQNRVSRHYSIQYDLPGDEQTPLL